MPMKKIFSLFILCIFCLCANAVEKARLYTSTPRLVETKGKTTTIAIDVFLDNDVAVDGFQFKAKLPDGIAAKWRNEQVKIADRVHNSQLLTAYSKIDDASSPYANKVTVALGNAKNMDPMYLDGRSGRVVTLELEVRTTTIKPGNYNIEFYEMSISSPEEGQSIRMPNITVPITIVSRLGDADLNRTVELADVTVATDMLLGQKAFIPEANVKYTDDVMTIGDITALIELLKNN